MDAHNRTESLRPLYLFKILLGLMLLSAIVLTALWLPLAGMVPLAHQVWLGVLLILALALPPFVYTVYRRRDELQRLLHKRASMHTLTLVATASCLLGILQAGDIVPLFNQFWTFGILVAAWGVNLMLADRHFR